MKKIAVYCEVENSKLNDTAYELISKAYELKHIAKNNNNCDVIINAVAIAPYLDEESVKKAYLAGSDNVILIKNNNFQKFDQITFSRAFLSFFYENFQDFILFPASLKGRIIAPRITTLLNTGLVADCTSLEFILNNNELKLAATRPTFGAELMATILSKKAPECATIRPKTFKANFCNNKIGKLLEFPCSISNLHNLKLISATLETEEEKHNFGNSKIVFAAGFGLYDGNNNEYINKLYELSKKCNVDFALSRKLVDYGVMSSDFQVGQTGATIAPDLYVAFGISGAIQHIMGIKNSKKIIAVNKDENAEIFKYSDYKIVADAKDIIDKMIEQFKIIQ